MPKGYDEDYDGIPDAMESPGEVDPTIEALREIRNIFRRESIQELLGEDESPGDGYNDAMDRAEPPMEDEDGEEMAPPARKPKSLSIIIAARKGKK